MLVCEGRGWREGNVPMVAVAMSKLMSYVGGLMTGPPGAMTGAMKGSAPAAGGGIRGPFLLVKLK
jgi:hypothetical protein